MSALSAIHDILISLAGASLWMAALVAVWTDQAPRRGAASVVFNAAFVLGAAAILVRLTSLVSGGQS